jgi:hypothetical protein
MLAYGPLSFPLRTLLDGDSGQFAISSLGMLLS